MVDILKKRTIFQMLSDVRITSDLDYQKNVWYSDNKEYSGNFNELICSFFDFYDNDELHEDPDSFGLSSEQYQALKFFGEELDKYSDNVIGHPTEERLMQDPEWHRMQKLAEETLNLFDTNLFI